MYGDEGSDAIGTCLRGQPTPVVRKGLQHRRHHGDGMLKYTANSAELLTEALRWEILGSSGPDRLSGGED